jgi:hypothetical protein
MRLMLDLLVPYTIPYCCQFASPDLVHDFIYEVRTIDSDPRWADYGAATPAEYAHWARRSCGVVCVKMAVEGITACTPQPVMAWVQAGLAIDGYLTELRPDRPDRPIEKGWKHASLAHLAQMRGCAASMIKAATIVDLADHLRAGRVIIASVTSELGEDGPITRSSGHLVLIYGVGLDAAGQVIDVILHNPSGRAQALQAGARIPIDRFRSGFSGRGIVIGPG